MGIISKFPSQSKTNDMTPPAPITGNPNVFETLGQINEPVKSNPYEHTHRILFSIPDHFIDTFRIKTLDTHPSTIVFHGTNHGASICIEPNKETSIHFRFSKTETENDLPLINEISIMELGKFTLSMSLQCSIPMLTISVWR